MVKEELKYQILQQFGFQPTSEQAHALEVFAQFLTDTTPHCAMILRGWRKRTITERTPKLFGKTGSIRRKR